MSNLLSTETKKEIHKEHRLRVIITALFLLTVLFLISVIWLVPIYILSANKYDITKTALSVAEGEISRVQPNDPKEIINNINTKLTILGEEPPSGQQAHNIIIDIVERKSNNIKITSISYNKAGEETRILLQGDALNRESLSSFVREIEKNELFSSVELPISNFVKEKDLDFSLTVYILHDQREEEEALEEE